MNFSEKLKDLRKEKGITQQQLADAIYVSRTAVSKWESQRGYPSIDSLKALAAYFSVTVDMLLSTDEALRLAEEDKRMQGKRFCSLVFSLADLLMGLLLFLPLFAQRAEGNVTAVSLFSLSVGLPLKATYIAAVALSFLMGILTLILKNRTAVRFAKHDDEISLALGAIASLLFVVGLHPYAATLAFALLAIKVTVLLKRG